MGIYAAVCMSLNKQMGAGRGAAEGARRDKRA